MELEVFKRFTISYCEYKKDRSLDKTNTGNLNPNLILCLKSKIMLDCNL